MGKEGPKDRLEMSREPTWAKKAQGYTRDRFKRATTWAKEVPRID